MYVNCPKISECREYQPSQVRNIVVVEIAQMATSHRLTEASHQKGVLVLNFPLTDPPLPTQTTVLHSCQTLELH